MSTVKSLDRFLNDKPVIIEKEPVLIEPPNDPVLIEDVYYIYPYKSKTEAAKDLKDFFDKTDLPEFISCGFSRIKKEFVSQTFDMINKYWKQDEDYILGRLIDLKTLKDCL